MADEVLPIRKVIGLESSGEVVIIPAVHRRVPKQYQRRNNTGGSLSISHGGKLQCQCQNQCCCTTPDSHFLLIGAGLCLVLRLYRKSNSYPIEGGVSQSEEEGGWQLVLLSGGYWASWIKLIHKYSGLSVSRWLTILITRKMEWKYQLMLGSSGEWLCVTGRKLNGS